MPRPPIARRDLVALGLAATCWGVGTVISKAALEEVPPLTLLPIQLAASLAILAILMRSQGISFRTEGSPLLGRLGLLNPGLAYALGLIGLTMITASLYVMLWALEPLMILFLAAWFLRERITPTFVVLSLVAVAGMVLIVYDPSSNGGELIGVALTVAGIACCAAYTVITRRWIPDAKETSQVVLAQQAHALALSIVLVIIVGLAGGAIRPTSLTPLGLASADRIGCPLLRRCLLVLPGRAPARPGFLRGAVVLPDPGRRRHGWSAPPWRAAGSAAVGRRGDRPRGHPGHHPPPVGGSPRVALQRRCLTSMGGPRPAVLLTFGTGPRPRRRRR